MVWGWDNVGLGWCGAWKIWGWDNVELGQCGAGTAWGWDSVGTPETVKLAMKTAQGANGFARVLCLAKKENTSIPSHFRLPAQQCCFGLPLMLKLECRGEYFIPQRAASITANCRIIIHQFQIGSSTLSNNKVLLLPAR